MTFGCQSTLRIDVLLPYALHVSLVSGHSYRNPKCNRNTPQRCPNVIPEPHAVQVKALASDVSPKCKAGICANSIATIATIIFFIFGSNISISSTCWILVEWGLSNFQRPRIWCCRSQSDGVFRCVSIHTPTVAAARCAAHMMPSTRCTMMPNNLDFVSWYNFGDMCFTDSTMATH